MSLLLASAARKLIRAVSPVSAGDDDAAVGGEEPKTAGGDTNPTAVHAGSRRGTAFGSNPDSSKCAEPG